MARSSAVGGEGCVVSGGPAGEYKFEWRRPRDGGEGVRFVLETSSCSNIVFSARSSFHDLQSEVVDVSRYLGFVLFLHVTQDVW